MGGGNSKSVVEIIKRINTETELKPKNSARKE
jgi:hypothetical protein